MSKQPTDGYRDVSARTRDELRAIGTGGAAKAGEDAGAPWGRRSLCQPPPVLERRCPHRPPPQAGMVRGPPAPPSIDTRRRCRHETRMRGRRYGKAGEDAGAPWGRRFMGPMLPTSGRASPGAPVSSPATAAGGHGPRAFRPTVHRYAAALSTRDSNEAPTVRRGRRGRRRSMGAALRHETDSGRLARYRRDPAAPGRDRDAGQPGTSTTAPVIAAGASLASQTAASATASASARGGTPGMAAR